MDNTCSPYRAQVKHWTITRNTNRFTSRQYWAVENNRTGFVDFPVRHSDGTVTYEWPEMVPQYVKIAVKDAMEAAEHA